MLVTVSGHHVDVTPAIKDYAYEKADKLARYFGAKEVVVTLKIEGGRHIAEFIVYAPKHHTLIATSEHADMYAAIDVVVDKIERQLVRLKEKWQDHHAKEGGLGGRSEEVSAQAEAEAEAEAEETEE